MNRFTLRGPRALVLLGLGMLSLLLLTGNASATVAPDFEATNLATGDTVSLQDLQGDVVRSGRR